MAVTAIPIAGPIPAVIIGPIVMPATMTIMLDVMATIKEHYQGALGEWGVERNPSELSPRPYTPAHAWRTRFLKSLI